MPSVSPNHTLSQVFVELQEHGINMEIGQSDRIVCPLCKGGSTHEKSMSIYRPNHFSVHTTCYRASCDYGSRMLKIRAIDGVPINRYSKLAYRETSRKELPMPPTTKLTKRRKTWLNNNLLLDDYKLAYGRVSATNDGRVVYTIFGPERQVRGKVVRDYHAKNKRTTTSFEPFTIPKSVNYKYKENDVLQSWYFKDRHARKASDTLIIVEDIPSALRCIDYCDSVALLGTSFTLEKQKEIKNMGYKATYICLDPDANKKALKLAKNSTVLPNMKIKFLDKDIKNMTHEELKTFMEGINL